MAEVKFESHLDEVLKATSEQLARAAETIGGMAESYAKELCPVKTNNLRTSIAHTTENNGRTVVVGSAVKYAPYVELGTGVHALGESHAKKIPWHYKDAKGKWHTTYGMPPRPYLRPAIEKHKDEYREVLKTEMSGG